MERRGLAPSRMSLHAYVHVAVCLCVYACVWAHLCLYSTGYILGQECVQIWVYMCSDTCLSVRLGPYPISVNACVCQRACPSL